ncbi:MAG: hypothetical protein R2715_11140 [Ilumatobacteraceae bacterium]
MLGEIGIERDGDLVTKLFAGSVPWATQNVCDVSAAAGNAARSVQPRW